jgi:hypothetical protein
MTKLYLDDNRTPLGDGWVVVRNHNEFVEYIQNNPMPDFISFDHDLAPEHYHNDMYKGQKVYNKLYKTFKEKTGLACAEYIGEILSGSGEKVPQFNVHSQNPAGKLNIKDHLLIVMLHNGEDPDVSTDEIPYKLKK